MSLTGTLSELALCDLVEITTLGAKTGVLDVTHTDDSPAGFLAFRGGAGKDVSNAMNDLARVASQRKMILQQQI